MKAKKICAAITAVALAAALCTGAIYATENITGDVPDTTEIISTDNKNSDFSAEKDETVYIIADANGTAKQIIVSDWLKNNGASSVLGDVSSLENIENVKGSETYSSDDGEIEWEADGSDIYYRGNSTESTPIEMKITYTLDGKEISAEELAGKSGKVKIRIDYTNNLNRTVEIDGQSEQICVPFAVITGTVLDNDTFKNVEVSSGKIINDGDRTIIAAAAFPELQSSLKIDSDKLDLPDYLEIEADVIGFKLEGIFAVAENSIFNDIELDGESSFDDLVNAADEMDSAMQQLMGGSSALADGLEQLDSKTGELISGITSLQGGAKQLSDGTVSLGAGADQLNTGAAQLSMGADTLAAGLSELDKNSTDLNNAAKQIFSSMLAQADSQLAESGLDLPKLTADNYAAVLDTAAAQVTKAAGEQAAVPITSLKTQLDNVNSFCVGLSAYTSGVSQSVAGAQTLQEGAEQLKNGAVQLKKGTDSLGAGTSALYEGITALEEGGTAMSDGISRLADGSKQLDEGLSQFNEEAVQKLVDAVNGDLDGLIERLRAISEVSETYNNYSGIADGTSGSVKFIYRTEAIEAD